MIANYKNELQKVFDIKDGKIKEGLKLDIPEIDEYFRFKRNAMVVIVGHANVGKTHLCVYLMTLYSLKHGTRWLIYSSENEVSDLLRKIIEFQAAKPIDSISKYDIEQYAKWANAYFKFIQPDKLYDYKELLKEAEEVYENYPYNGFLIDPYNSLKKNKEMLSKSNAYDYTYECLSDIRLFCKTKNVSIWINTHAVTEALRRKHPKGHYYENHPMPCAMSDVEMGGAFGNRTDDFLSFHRYTGSADWMYSEIHVKKIKNLESGGRPTMLESPIRLRSLSNNVGFSVNGKNLAPLMKLENKIEIPF